jgi:hypothetical protein
MPANPLGTNHAGGPSRSKAQEEGRTEQERSEFINKTS